jgi:hypothetical protein
MPLDRCEKERSEKGPRSAITDTTRDRNLHGWENIGASPKAYSYVDVTTLDLAYVFPSATVA